MQENHGAGADPRPDDGAALIVVPPLGLSKNARLRVSAWLVGLGDAVIEGDRVVELATDDLTVDLASPASGYLASITVHVGQRVDVQAVLGTIGVTTEQTR